jgi:diaminopimelate decarboxylase
VNKRTVPLTKDQLENITKEYPTPFYFYDEKAIREQCRSFKKAFDWVPTGFKNYFAVKALPNPYILKILKEEGMGADCSSFPELILSDKAGITGEDIMFTSNDTPLSEFKKAKELGAVINLDDITHLTYLEKIGLPDLICFRYNPGPLKGGNSIIGKPEEAKYGLTREQLSQAYKMAKEKGVKRFGLHTMVASNELNTDYFIETVELLLSTAAELNEELNINFEFINFGGGIGIPYRPDEKAIDFNELSRGIKKLYTQYVVSSAMMPPKIYFETGRVVTGPFGYLATRVLHTKDTYKKYWGTDACMADLMRPGMYGAYHHITVMDKEDQPPFEKCDITGSLCENCDKFAIDRELPPIEIGDLLVIHDGGAHGRAMGFNYNAKLRSGELLLREDGSVKEIRRRETVEDYFATLNFDGLEDFK